MYIILIIIIYFEIKGVEKKNDNLRRYFHRKINRWDAATNLLLVEKWQEVLRGYEREKRGSQKGRHRFGRREENKRPPRRL